MGISDHIDLDDLGHETQHLFDGSVEDMKSVAVDTMGCGPLTIIMPPDHPEDDMRDQHALFVRARTLDGKEVELMFNIGQVALLSEQTHEVMHEHIQQAFKLLNAPDHITDGYYEAKRQLDDIIGTITSISTMSEMVMKLNDVKKGDGTIDEKMIENLTTDDAKNLLRMVTDVLESGDGHLPGCPKGHHTHDGEEDAD